MTRNYSIDVMRILSAIAVVMIHTVTAPVKNATGEVEGSLSNSLYLINMLLLWAVPVFFMITGYCLSLKKECTYSYCFHHILKFIKILFTVGLFYSLLEEVFIAKKFSITILGKSIMNVFTGNLWDHMWFIYAIIGVYLVMPVLHSFIQQGEKNIYILTSLLFLFTILLPTIEEWFSIGIDFPFCGYLFYVCFGAVIAKCKLKRWFYYICYFLGGLSAIFIITKYDNHYLFGNKSLAVCLMAMSIFLKVSGIKVKQNKFILKISECTLGIYLLHPLFINLVIKLFKIDLLTTLPYIKLFVFFGIITAVSFICTFILRKIPLIKGIF